MPSPLTPEVRRAVRVLAMVAELHKQGYQCLRICPGMAPSGMWWRCSVTPVDNILINDGAMLMDWDHRVAHHSSADENRFFGWGDATSATARDLAVLFIERLPEIADAGRGEDWAYAGWYVQMLGLAEEGYLPLAYDDDQAPVRPGTMRLLNVSPTGRGERNLPNPPPGLGAQPGG